MLSEPWDFRFPYKRAAGRVPGTFLAGLREKRLLGLRKADGGVVLPPHGYHPQTSEPLSEWVECPTWGSLLTWTWIASPRQQHHSAVPFAYALIQINGVETAMLHKVRAKSEAELRIGQPVGAVWAEQPQGHISDILYFAPCDRPADRAIKPVSNLPKPIDAFDATFVTHYEISAGRALSDCLTALKSRRILAKRGDSGNVYVTPVGADALTGTAVSEDVDLTDTGTVTRFCVVNIPVRGQAIEVPFVAADILIDGVDNTFMAMIQGLPFDQVRLGLRVRAVWQEDDALVTNMGSIKWFEPNGEPDVDLATVEAYL